MIKQRFSVGIQPGLRIAAALLASASLLVMTACSDGSDQLPSGPSTAPFAELYQQGIDRYLGVYTPMLSETDGDLVNHFFGAGDGPLCQLGAPYSMATRDQGAQELLIFLEEGGACWSDFCFSTTQAIPGIPEQGILDIDRGDNPVKDWNQVYVPYCDGSLHAGDQDVDSDNDGQVDRYQRGLHNLSAALDVAVNTFPAPARIVLAGHSGGGLGTIFALPMVRRAYPDTMIEVINDSGVGVVRPDQPEFLQQLLDEWNMQAFIPASCPNCVAADGHLTDYLVWQMDQDPTLRRSMLSYSRDFMLADTFLQIGKDAFEQALYAEMQQQEQAHPDRSHYWIPDGEGHTFIKNNPDETAGGVALMDWLGYMLSGSDQWQSVTD